MIRLSSLNEVSTVSKSLIKFLMMNRPPLFEIRHASKSYNGIPALINAELTLLPGEVHALMGENGAGKSTLIKIMAGVVAPDAAETYAHGQIVFISTPQAAKQHGLRFIHQELNVVPQLSVAENIYLGQRYPTIGGLFVNWQQLNAAARHVLGQLGITHLNVRQKMARLSPGDQMLVNIAHAFVGDDLTAKDQPALVYVMDEPTASLTGQEIEQLFGVINRLRERGSAVLYVSHRLDEIFRIADRVTVMRDGRVVETRTIDRVTPAELIFMMTGRELQQVYPPRSQSLEIQPILEVRKLTTHHVQDISFDLRAGEILGIAGLSGSGRTQVLRGIIGADEMLSGNITLNGRLLPRLTPTSAWERGIAFVPEERRSQGLVLTRSITNNVTLPQLKHYSYGGAVLAHQRERNISGALGQSVKLKARGVRQSVRQLSGGNQQKVVFARALARSPRVLLLAEPTRGVDVAAKADIYQLIREISGQGVGIVMVSSDLPELIGMSDRLLIMKDGRLIHTVENNGLTQEQVLTLCYGQDKV
jgi:ABC-type sugar transport system ATPase subunit